MAINRIISIITTTLCCLLLTAQKPEVVLTTGHSDQVNCMDMNNKGTLLATGGNDKNVKVWDVATSKEVWTLSGNDSRIQFVKFSEDNNYLGVSDYSEKIKCWNMKNGQLIYTSESAMTHDPFYYLDNRSIVYMSTENKIVTWDFISNTKKAELDIWYAYRFALSADKKRIFVLTVDGKLKTFNRENGNVLDSTVLFEKDKMMLPITPMEISKDGKYIAIALYDNTVKVLDANNLKEVAALKGMTLAIYDMIFKETDPDHLFVLDANKVIRCFSVSQKKELIKISNMLFGSVCLEVHPTQEYFLANEVKTVHYCRASDGNIIKSYKSIVHKIVNMAYDQQGKFLATAADDVTLKIWDVRENKISRVISGFFPVAFSPDGSKLLSSYMSINIAIWNPETGQKLGELPTEYEVIQNLSFSTNGKLAAGAGFMGVIKLWDIEQKKLVRKFTGHAGGIYGTSFSPDEKLIASCGLDNTIRIWDVSNGKEIKKIEAAHEVVASDIKFSPDGKLLATCGWDKKIKLWNTSDWTENKTLEGHINVITSIDFSADGKLLCSASGNNVVSPADNSIRVWDVASGKELCKMLNPTGQINKVIMEKKGDHLYSCSEDGLMKIWNYKNCTEIAGYIAANSTEHLIFTPDNYYMCSRAALATVSFRVDGQIYPFEQFDIQLNRPDIIAQRIGKTPQNLINAYQYVYSKRMKKLGFTEEKLSGNFHLPQTVLSDRNLPIITKEKTQKIKLHLQDDQYKIDRLQVYINDVPVYGLAGIDMKTYKSGSIDYELNLDLMTGKNKIQLSCINEKGIESLAETIEMQRDDIAGASGNLYLITIGVSQYKDNRFNLKYAAKDADDIAGSLVKTQNLYKNIFTKTFKDATATKENFASLKEFLKNTSVDDVVIVFIAGHGVLDDKFDYYYCTSDVDFDNPSARGLAYDEIEGVFNGIKAVRKLLLMDTCHSGELDKDEVEKTKVVESGEVAFRAVGEGVRKKEGFGVENSVQLMENLFSNIKKGTGTTVISSAGGAEFAMESDVWKNGLFTYCLLNGMKEKLADTNGNGEVCLSELQKYVKEKVSELSKGQQVPTARTENLILDYRLW